MLFLKGRYLALEERSSEQFLYFNADHWDCARATSHIVDCGGNKHQLHTVSIVTARCRASALHEGCSPPPPVTAAAAPAVAGDA
jgi:hypothetical protein